ncbi:hypothetical protein [Paenibacillus kandeliae]|uniref:hypothetical protein n=1 Tax=Paenibacillus kandeliae TaxID=3231269 RepID=UPI00345790BC
MTAILTILFMAAIALPQMWYYAALGKRMSEEEKKAGRDLTYELNPFTGGRDL